MSHDSVRFAAPLEPRALRDGARRTIPWPALDVARLDPQRRTRLGQSWRERMRSEHLAVGAFSILTQGLAALGAPPVVLSIVARAVADEVRHTEICRRMAVACLGEADVPARYRGVPNVPRHAGASDAERVLLHVVEMCCLSESLAGIVFTEMRRRARNDACVAAMESLLEDEIDHGRVGWAYLAAVHRDSDLGPLSRELPRLLSRTVGRTLDPLRPSEQDDPALEAYAYLGGDTVARLTREALRDVVFPGFELLGVDTQAARESALDAGWLPST